MFTQIPPITKNLLIINVLAFFAHVVLKDRGFSMNDTFGLHFIMASDFQFYQLFTYMFMHANVSHLFFNMFALWMFGCTIERAWGSQRFLVFTLLCGVGAGIFQELAQFVSYAVQGLAAYDSVNISGMIMSMDSYLNQWNTVGFSGAVYGILLGFGMTYPEERIFVFPLPFPIKGKWFVCIYAAIELFSALGTSNDNVAHIAHLGGMVVGFFIIRYWKYKYDHRYGSNNFQGWDGYEIKSRQSFFQRVKQWYRDFSKNIFHSSSNSSSDSEAEREKKRQKEIDRILDKIKRNGYDSLTDEERRKLFDRK